ncbi:D-glycero-beta-D-manno-heptose-7-phosphate kinase [Melioribacteraceae bacterium 4301-Me]|uniref:D-glycero-beta-D-manno-heptose-7-phosphate kinase n=1 Tax=Pyranulibacter aquaticus TaxID=3163344 RepID=UPI0035994055
MMLNISIKKLEQLKKKFIGKKIAVVGDMMLDGYFWGGVKRISPEAPVPIVEIDNEIFRFGGAMNVANNILSLGATPIPIGLIGDDNDGKIFKQLLKEKNIIPDAIITEKGRPTTTKTRVIADNQHIVRIDKEKTHPIKLATEKKIMNFLTDIINDLDAIILEDYNKGVLTKSLIQSVIKLANQKNIIITVDPKFDNFFEYKNVTVFKPNRKETEDAFGIRIVTNEDITNAGKRILEILKSKYVILTLGEKGLAIFENGKSERKISTKARKVADVSGAGDTVISTLTVALAAGADIYQASYLANFAAGIVCQEVGIVPIELDALFNAVKSELK